jgi:tetratricopeptide (TPR) repeat protein
MLAGCCVLLLAATTGIAAEGEASCSPALGRLVSLQGTIELLRSGTSAWQRVARLNTPICAGDQVRAGLLSRAALFISPETLVRLDQNTTLAILSQTEQETIVEFKQDDAIRSRAGRAQACGIGYFITRFPRKFRVRTPFYNAVVEGTEFQVALQCDRGDLSVFEGKVAAEAVASSADRVVLESGQNVSVGPGEGPKAVKVLVKPADAVQWAVYYPPVGDTPASLEQTLAEDCGTLPEAARSACVVRHAEALLRVGRVAEAGVGLDQLLAAEPSNAEALALNAVIAIAKNEKDRALELATKATQAGPQSFRAWIALSYARQAGFRLDDALSAANKAAEVAPQSALVRTRVAELLLSLGRIREAEKEARTAVSLNPAENRAHLMLGFVHLAQIDTKAARQDFETAIELDSSEPLARLGLGLATIRSGKLAEGREQIEIAVALDPTNSLVRSYIGKAYYEENSKERDKLAATQLGLAKQLDPNDPTPWFYDAIFKQTQNRPVEGLEDLRASIQLNSNRAVYRSRLQLDQDTASRGVSVARTYQDLGFTEPGLVEASASLQEDPASFSAHRFLADMYASTPRAEIARASELLQAQLWQPLGSPPLQPQLANDTLFLLGGLGPTAVGLYEFNPMFARNGPNLQLYGLAGEHNTSGHQVVFNGLTGPVSFSLSKFGANTDGYRQNNFNDKILYDAFLQAQISADTSIQAEVTSYDQRYGDLVVRFDPNDFASLTNQALIDSFRLGLRQRLAAESSLLVSYIHTDRRDEKSIPGFGALINTRNISDAIEVQNLSSLGSVKIVSGLGYFGGETTETFFFSPTESNPLHFNAYSYVIAPVAPLRLTLQVGLSYDRLRSVDSGDQAKWNPKLGVVWRPTASTTVRAATFRVLRRRINADQGLEPTQVAGFNQYFDDVNGATSRRVAIGVDQQFGQKLRAGVEWSKRDISSPLTNGSAIDFDPWEERSALGYFHWTPTRWLAASARAAWERYERPFGASTDIGFTMLDTWYYPLSLRVFSKSGFTGALTVTPVSQRGQFYLFNPDPNLYAGDDRFCITDLFLSYRLPRRAGIITIGVRNLFDEQFRYQSVDPTGSRFAPERTVFARLSLNFGP